MLIIKRFEENPLLVPMREHPWEAVAAFNWCPIQDGDKVHVVYRALSNRELLEEPKINRSVVGRATSTDGIHYTDRAPFIVPDRDFDTYGCEDPRVTKIDDTYYTFYTALSDYPFNASNIKVAVALSKDLTSVTQKHLVTPFNAKAMTLFPKKINGKYVAVLTIHTDLPDTNIAIAMFDSIEQIWSKEYWDAWYAEKDSHVIELRRGSDEQTEVGAVPIETKDGWLLIYSHATHYFSSTDHTFGVEAILLDKNDPKKIIGRTSGPFMVPEVFYERTGFVPNIVFPSGALIRGEYLDIYYGGADTFCCKASVRLEDLLAVLNPKKSPLITRYQGNPILAPRPKKEWEDHGVFNPAAVEYNDTIHILYRAMGSDDTSTVGLATSKDGVTIDERLLKPIYTPRAPFESKYHAGNSGVEDPRIVYMEGKFWMTYTAYDGSVPRVAITSITEKDFADRKWKNWTMPNVITPENVDNKDAALVPERTSQGYMMLHRVNQSVCADFVQTLDFTKESIKRCIEILAPRRGMWDGLKVGIAAPPIKTKAGWLLFYHGVSENSIYRVGAALLSLKDPSIVLSRTALPLFEPQEEYERVGVVPNVVFPCGIVNRKGKLFIYYGGADKVVGVATAKLADIIKILT